MKPIIISVQEDKDGYIRIKKEDFEKYIEQAYEAGKAENKPYITTAPWNYRDTTYQSLKEINPEPRKFDGGLEITCRSGGDING